VWAQRKALDKSSMTRVGIFFYDAHVRSFDLTVKDILTQNQLPSYVSQNNDLMNTLAGDTLLK
jgi:hypothetical protein